MMPKKMPTLRDIYRARNRIEKAAWHTPLVPSPDLSRRLSGGDVYLKLECLQHTGSFKVRGAANKMLNLNDEERNRGVIAFSTGNHGRGVAFTARQLGIRAVIFLSDRVPGYRVKAMKKLGAEVVQKGAGQDDAYDHALALQQKEGLTMVAPFDDPEIIAGQGTIGIEILAQLPDLGTVIVPLSGGGLISGIARAVKSASPNIRVIGVSMAAAPAMYHCIKAGKPVEIEEKDSLADALLGGIGLDNAFTFSMVRELVDEIVLVSEQEIAGAMFFAFDRHRLVVEGSGAVGMAALQHDKISDPGKKTVVVVSGGNVDPSLLMKISSKYYHAKPSYI